MGLCLITVHTLTANMEPRLADAQLTLSPLTLPKTRKLLALSRGRLWNLLLQRYGRRDTGRRWLQYRQITRAASNNTVRNTGWHGTCLLILPLRRHWEIPVVRSPLTKGREFNTSAVTASRTERQTRQFTTVNMLRCNWNGNKLANTSPCF